MSDALLESLVYTAVMLVLGLKPKVLVNFTGILYLTFNCNVFNFVLINVTSSYTCKHNAVTGLNNATVDC